MRARENVRAIQRGPKTPAAEGRGSSATQPAVTMRRKQRRPGFTRAGVSVRSTVPAARRPLLNRRMLPIVNIAAYKFVALDKLVELRGELSRLCRREQLRGTILLSHEGINVFVAGGRDWNRRAARPLARDTRRGRSSRSKRASAASSRSIGCWSRSSARSSPLASPGLTRAVYVAPRFSPRAEAVAGRRAARHAARHSQQFRSRGRHI